MGIDVRRDFLDAALGPRSATVDYLLTQEESKGHDVVSEGAGGTNGCFASADLGVGARLRRVAEGMESAEPQPDLREGRGPQAGGLSRSRKRWCPTAPCGRRRDVRAT